jgi:hypothetical protein
MEISSCNRLHGGFPRNSAINGKRNAASNIYYVYGSIAGF